jgi:deazaflavin-dependent oxidoreductase (nitroreductase family)
MRVPRGFVVASAAATALVWGLYALDPSAWPGLTGAIAQTALLLVNLVVTTRSPRTKILIVRAIQRHVVNPLVRLLFRVGINPLGLAILETRGRVSGRPRRTPVGNGRVGDEFWIIAEHGRQAGYVRNIEHDPRVRIRLRVGWRYRWVPGVAEIRPHDDAVARQRAIIRWRPLRILNAMNVRVLGADLLVVRVRLQAVDGSRPGTPPVLPDHRAASHGNSLRRPVGGTEPASASRS